MYVAQICVLSRCLKKASGQESFNIWMKNNLCLKKLLYVRGSHLTEFYTINSFPMLITKNVLKTVDTIGNVKA